MVKGPTETGILGRQKAEGQLTRLGIYRRTTLQPEQSLRPEKPDNADDKAASWSIEQVL